MFGKHSSEGYTIKQLQKENGQLNQTIALKDREIEDIKTECANQFKLIHDLCFCNNFEGKWDRLNRIYEIAQDNFSALVKDLAIDKLGDKAKIIELSTARQSNR